MTAGNTRTARKCVVFGFLSDLPPIKASRRGAHRGPDGPGWRVFDSVAGPVALGHRRLSIIDLSDAAQQPMGRPTIGIGSFTTAKFIITSSCATSSLPPATAFSPSSDTEVLLAAYADWGEAALDRLVGMFAFVLWDAPRSPSSPRATRSASSRSISSPHRKASPSRPKSSSSSALQGFSARLNIARAYDFLSSGIMEHTDGTLFDAVGSCAAASASVSTCSAGAPAKNCQSAAGTVSSSRARSTSVSVEAAEQLPRAARTDPYACTCVRTCRSAAACRAASTVRRSSA